jgi:hypothetical protein
MRLTGDLEPGRLRDRTELHRGKIEAIQRHIGDLRVQVMMDDLAEDHYQKIPVRKGG